MKSIKRNILFLFAALCTVSMVACSSKDKKESTKSDVQPTTKVEEAVAFPKFQGTDFEGNDVDESLFGENVVTVLNFWFNGCTACVNEMSGLEKFNEQLKEKGAELVGVNVDVENKENALQEAKSILKDQGATYRNIIIHGGAEANEYLNKMMVFPTTVLIDRNGNMIGEPITGTIDDKEMLAKIMKTVEDAVEAEK